MYVKCLKKCKNVRKIQKYSHKCTKISEIFTKSTRPKSTKNSFMYVKFKKKSYGVHKIPLEFNSSYTLKPSCEPPGSVLN